MKVYGTVKTSFKTVKFNSNGNKYLNSQKWENRIIEHIDNRKTNDYSNIIPIKTNEIGRLWSF